MSDSSPIDLPPWEPDSTVEGMRVGMGVAYTNSLDDQIPKAERTVVLVGEAEMNPLKTNLISMSRKKKSHGKEILQRIYCRNVTV